MPDLKIRILIADDHALMRVGLTALFSHQPDMLVVGEAHDGYEALDLVKARVPDVVVMDLMMPKMNGVEATRQIREASPTTRVFVLTSYGTAPELAQAVANGATGAAIKSVPTEEILDAVRAVYAGRRAFSDEIVQLIAENEAFAGLTARQQEILDAAARGLTTNDIATAFGISASCVLKHFTAIFERLGVSNRSEAVATALNKHLLKD